MATRSKRFFLGVTSGYGLMAVNIAYTMLSIPLALHYLGKEEFGMWALAQQLAGYLMLIDLGMSQAVSRFLADHKDNVNGGEYGSLLLTGALVFALQSIIVITAGASFSFFAPKIFGLPPSLHNQFSNILLILSFTASLSLFFRSLSAPLWAFQRMDVNNFSGAISLIISLLVLWFGFSRGWGVYSIALAGIPGFLISNVITFYICWKSGYYPARACWKMPRLNAFKRVFSFGRDVFFITVGTQLVNASQIMIISRVAGLDSAATFAVGTKLYTMAQQFVSKIIESSAPVLTEMLVRIEINRFNQRFWNLMTISCFLATVASSGLILGNGTFIIYWTAGSIHWSPIQDALLSWLLAATTITRFLTGIFAWAGNLRPTRRIYFFEGVTFIALAIPLTTIFGIVGTLIASLAAHLSVTGVISAIEASKLLKTLKPAFHIFITSYLSITLVFLFAQAKAQCLSPESTLSIVLSIFFFLASATVSWFVIVPASLRSEIVLKYYRQR